MLAIEGGFYRCYNCPWSPVIYLKEKEVWKYGVTRKGEKGRYGNSLGAERLFYLTEFVGTIQECLAEERRKIFNYALFPENIARPIPIIRPPGNKYDT